MTEPNLWDPTTFTDGFPHELFRTWRDERPIFRSEHPVWPTGFWNLTRHADIVKVSRDADTWSSQPTPFLDVEAATADNGASLLMISLDPPDHTKMRKIVNRGFTPKRVQDLAEKIQGQVDRLIDNVANRDGCDLVKDVAVELPLQVIADLVGVPEPDRHQIFEWTEKSFGFDAAITAQERMQASFDMYAYADRMCEIRKSEPHDDLMSVLMNAEVDGHHLEQLQIDVFFLLLQNAGSETTRNLITSGTLALLQHPEQLELLRREPQRIPAAVEELLRYVTPVVQFVRRARRDVEIGGQLIKQGEAVVMWYPSANRDDRVFADPNRLDVTRDASQQVSFGAGGAHFCLGASLARLEARMMFESIIERFVDLEVAVDPSTLPRVHSNLIDGLSAMPVKWGGVRDRAARTGAA